VTVDLEVAELRVGNHVVRFTVEPFSRECLLEGVDTLGWLLARTPAIEAFERAQAA
jgi:3-isopropylmalate/(R)-2-methylmalate dehydratase small subunit